VETATRPRCSSVTLRDHFGQDLGAGKSGARHHQTWLLQGSGVNYGEEEEWGGAEGLGGVSGHAFGHDCPLGLGYRKRGPRGRRRKYDNTVRRPCRRFRRYLSTEAGCASSRVCVVKPCLHISPGLQFCRSFNVVLFSLPSLLFPTNPFSSPPPPPPTSLAPRKPTL
jgi:hypothetical protein